MKRFFAVALLSLLMVQVCLLPLAVEVYAQPIPCPSAVTLPATDIVVATATLNGRLNIPDIELEGMLKPNGISLASLQYTRVTFYKIFVSFQYGSEPGVYTSETPATEGSASGNVQASVSGLRPCTTYYYRVKLHTERNIVPNVFHQYRDSLHGAGVGLDYKRLQQNFNNTVPCPDSYGNEVSFQTLGCINPGGHQSGGVSAVAPSTRPFLMSNIVVQSATIAASKVSPGETVDITANVQNTGGSNGSSKVTLYINGQEVESKGIALSSGQSTTMNFSVSRNDPGTYTVLVNGVPAGSFTVDLFTNKDVLIYGIIALFTIGIIGVLFLVVKRRTA